MSIIDLQSPTRRDLRRRLDVGHLIRALMLSTTVCAVVALLVMVDRAEAPDEAFATPMVASTTVSVADHRVRTVVAQVKQEIREEVREPWSSDTSSAGTRPDGAH